MNQIIIDTIPLQLAYPENADTPWIGMNEYLEDIMACWSLLHKKDLPLTPRIMGKPGVGKTTLAIAAARQYGRPAYVYQCTMDTRPEDLLITPFINQNQQISYFAGPIVSAMINGGVAILDEGNRMSEKAWASLAALLDHRRSIESMLTGLKIQAHPDFRCCVTMNDDASTYEIPEYILSRLQPRIFIDFPPEEEERQILKTHVEFAEETLLDLVVKYLQHAHELDLDFSTRDGIHLLRYTLRLKNQRPHLSELDLFTRAIAKILGDEALNPDDYANKRRLKLPNEKIDFGQWQDNFKNYSQGFQALDDFLNNNPFANDPDRDDELV